MDKPSGLAFSDEGTFRFLRAEIMIPGVIIASGFILVMLTMETPFAGLGIPALAMGAAWLGWIGLFVVIAWGHRLWETRAIRRMFADEIWECWQFSTSEWEQNVDSVCNLISPKDEGKDAYSGVIASSIYGFVIAVILFVITFFAFDEPEMKIAMRVVAVGIFLFMIGVGIFQPVAARKKADRYRRKALRIKEPRVWFGPDGTYHETLGHTSLKELHKVTDQTKSRKRIQFTLVYSTDRVDELVQFHSAVPSGCDERASRLVRRYREERKL